MLIFIIFLGMLFTFKNDYSFIEKNSNGSQKEQILDEYQVCTGFIYHIWFIKDQAYGDTDEIFLGSIWDVDVDSEGRVYIADAGNVTIHVYDSDGSYFTSIGQQGRGPGEFLHVTHHTKIHINHNKLFVTGTEWIFSDKVQVFSLHDLSFSHEIIFDESDKKAFDQELENYFPKKVTPLENEHLLVSYEYVRSPEYLERDENKIMYYLHDKNGKIVTGPVLEQKDRTYLYLVYNGRGYNYYAFPFFAKSIFTVSDDGYLYSAFSDAFRIDVRTPNGKLVRTIEHSFDNITTSRRELIQKYEGIDMSRLDFNEGDDVALQMIREADNLPESWPALNDLLIDDENRLWVSTIVEDFDIYEWWVLEETGELITRFEWPRDEPIEVVKNGYMYTRETDEVTGLQQVVRYRVEMTEAE